MVWPVITDRDASVSQQEPIVTLEPIQQLSQLVTVRREMNAVLTESVSGYTGGTSMVLLVCGSLEMAVDLSKAKIVRQDVVTKVILISLPPPELREPYLDLNRTQVYSLNRKGLWSLIPGDAGEGRLMAKVHQLAMECLNQTGQSEELHTAARQQAEQVLVQFVRELGWQLVVVWQE